MRNTRGNSIESCGCGELNIQISVWKYVMNMMKLECASEKTNNCHSLISSYMLYHKECHPNPIQYILYFRIIILPSHFSTISYLILHLKQRFVVFRNSFCCFSAFFLFCFVFCLKRISIFSSRNFIVFPWLEYFFLLFVCLGKLCTHSCAR